MEEHEDWGSKRDAGNLGVILEYLDESESDRGDVMIIKRGAYGQLLPNKHKPQ